MRRIQHQLGDTERGEHCSMAGCGGGLHCLMGTIENKSRRWLKVRRVVESQEGG